MSLKKVIYAHGIHSGGGLTLLRAILSAIENNDDYKLVVDTRTRKFITEYHLNDVEYFSPGIFGRLRSELRLRLLKPKVKKILSFNSLPFLIPVGTPTAIFFQNVNLLRQAELSSGWAKLKSRLFTLTASRVEDFIVQTNSVKRLLFNYANINSRVFTMLESDLFDAEDDTQNTTSSSVKKFVYVADGERHKNHDCLLKAWNLLFEQFPELDIQLLLTLPDSEDGVWRKMTTKYDLERLRVSNLGVITRSKVLELYKECDALIFPSLSESMGLPLLEAKQAKLDIIASELDYVRDVVNPVEVFNPESELSIARAIARYLGLVWPKSVVPVTAKELLDRVFAN
jgi:glycosyltransferase involved in cell wall biosynthesis